MEQITLRVHQETKESLQEEADEHGQSMSEYVRTLFRTRNDDTEDSERVQRLQNKLAEMRAENEELQRQLTEKRDTIDKMRKEREEHIRLEGRVERLEADLERVRDERDRFQARYHESQGKLKVHNSEKGLWTRLKEKF